MDEVASASSELISASESIEEALQLMSSSIGGGTEEEMDLSQLEEVIDVLSQLSQGMLTMGEEISPLKDGFSHALEQLTNAIENIPELPVDVVLEIQHLYGTDERILMLLQAYEAAQTVKGVFEHEQIQAAFQSVVPTLDHVDNALMEMGNTLAYISQQLSSSLSMLDISAAFEELENGLVELSNDYGEFHSGLVTYTNGITQLSNSYSDIHKGMVELSTGTTELEDGVNELHDGTKELYDSTKEMPDKMKEEIDEMMAEYDKSDFVPVSYVSEK